MCEKAEAMCKVTDVNRTAAHQIDHFSRLAQRPAVNGGDLNAGIGAQGFVPSCDIWGGVKSVRYVEERCKILRGMKRNLTAAQVPLEAGFPFFYQGQHLISVRPRG